MFEEFLSPKVTELIVKAEADELSPEPSQPKLSTATPYKTACVSNLSDLVAAGELFGTIYADPPWEYSNRSSRGAASKHYRTMSIEDIAALPVGELAAPNAHLHLWTTNAFLFECERLMQRWGFRYRSAFVWVKPTIGCGNYWRVSHEYLLLGVRGRCPFRKKTRRSWQLFARGRHSAKPEAIRALIELVSPGPYLELFGRRATERWVVWGDNIRKEKTLFDSR